MTLGHRPLVDGVSLGGLPLRLLEREDPVRRGAGQRAGGSLVRRRRSGRNRHGGLDPHRALPGGCGRGIRRSGRGRLRKRRGPRGVRGGKRRGAARRGIELSVVAAVDRDGELRARGRPLGSIDADVGEELRGREGHARRHEARERELERLDAVPPLPVEVHGEVGPAVEDAPQEPREDRARPHLQERPRTGGVHRLDHLDEADLARDLAREGGPQGLGGLFVRRGERVRVDRERGRRERDVCEEAGKRLAGARHEARVERGGDGETLERDPLGREARLELRDVGRRARDDDLRRSVVVRDDDPRGEAREERADVLDRQRQRRHGARDRGRLGHQLAAAPRHSQEVRVAREDARRAERDDLAEAVAPGQVGTDPGLLEESELREGDAGDGRLGPLRGGEPREVALLLLLSESRPREDDFVERGARLEVEVRGPIPGVERGSKPHGEVRAHPHVLAPLSREEEGDLPLVRARPVGGSVRKREGFTRCGLDPLRGLEELLREVVPVRGEDRETRGGVRAIGVLRFPSEHRDPTDPLDAVLVLRERPRPRHDLRRVVAAEDDQLPRERPEARRARRGAPVLLEGDVEVRAAEAERAHRGAARMAAVAHPGARFRAQVEGTLGKAELRVRCVDLDRRGEHPVVERHDRLEEARRAGGGLGVADLALHRAERAPLPFSPPGGVEHQAQPFELGDVAGLRPGAVRLDELHRLRPVARELVRTAEREGLPRRHRRVDALAAPVRGRADAADRGIDPVAVALGVFQPLERDHPEPFAQHRAVGLVAEGAAVAAQRERRRLREAEVHEDVVESVDAAGDDEVAVPELQLGDGHRERAQGRSAGRVADAVRPAQVEAVRDPPRDDVPEEPRERRFLPRHVVARDPVTDRRHLFFREARLAERLHPDGPLQATHHRGEELLGARDAEDHGDARTVRRLELLAEGVLEDLLRHDEREELRRVGRRDRRRRNAPAEGVEVDLVEERAPLRVGLVGGGRVGVVVVLDEPVARRDVLDQVRAGEDVLPETGGVAGAGEEGADADDGDGLPVRGGVVLHSYLAIGRLGGAGRKVRRADGDGSRRRWGGRRAPRRAAAARGSPRRRPPSGCGRPAPRSFPRASRGSCRGPTR